MYHYVALAGLKFTLWPAAIAFTILLPPTLCRHALLGTTITVINFTEFKKGI